MMPANLFDLDGRIAGDRRPAAASFAGGVTPAP